MKSMKKIYKTKVMNTRGLYTSKETHIHQKRPIYIKRELPKKLTEFLLMNITCGVCVMSKETYIRQKRPICIKGDQYK